MKSYGSWMFCTMPYNKIVHIATAKSFFDLYKIFKILKFTFILTAYLL